MKEIIIVLPIMAILGGLAAATGIGTGLYGLGSNIKAKKDQKNEKLKAEQQAKKNALKFKQQGGISGAGFTPGAQPSSFFGGSPAGFETFNQYTPQQQQAFNTVLQQALSGLGKNQFDFAPIEAQARQGFSQNTIPSIAERFSKLGAQKSSAFGQQLGAAGAGFETDLAALKANYGLNQQQALHNLLGIGLKPQFESLYRPGSEGFGKNLLQSLLGSTVTGENISSVINALKGIQLPKKQDGTDASSTGGSNPLLDATIADVIKQGWNPQPNPGATPNLTGLNLMTNPGNIAPGMTTPTATQVPQVTGNNQITNMNAMKALYGI